MIRPENYDENYAVREQRPGGWGYTLKKILVFSSFAHSAARRLSAQQFSSYHKDSLLQLAVRLQFLLFDAFFQMADFDNRQ